MTDSRATQVSIEQFIATTAPAQVTQVSIEQWAATATVAGRAMVTQVGLEQWASSDLVVVVPPATGAQARVMVMA